MTSPVPRGLGPLSVFPYVPVSALLPAFLKRKPADGLGFQGGLPWRLFASFLGAEKGGGQQARPIFQGVLVFVRAYKPLS